MNSFLAAIGQHKALTVVIALVALAVVLPAIVYRLLSAH